MKSIGIYPGTFDPVHDGHLAFAEAAKNAFGLDVVYFAPEQTPRNKTNVSELNARTARLHAAVSERDGLDVVTLSSDQFNINDTKPEIETLFGADSYTLLVGSDVARTIDKWPGLDVLLSTWKLAVGMRGNDAAEPIEEMFKRIEITHGFPVDRVYIYTDKARLSSSDFRE